MSMLNNGFVSGCMKNQIFYKMFDYIVFLAELGRKSTEYNLNDVLYNSIQDKIDQDMNEVNRICGSITHNNRNSP